MGRLILEGKECFEEVGGRVSRCTEAETDISP